MCIWVIVMFFFKQKTAYEMRISDWSSDVCSSDLDVVELVEIPFVVQELVEQLELRHEARRQRGVADIAVPREEKPDRHHRERRPLHPQRHFMRGVHQMLVERETALPERHALFGVDELVVERDARDRKSTRLNYSH